MNVFRRVMSVATDEPDRSRVSSESSSSSLSMSKSSSSISLGATHLRKLLAELTRPPHPLNESEKERRIYAIVPLFIKMCSSSSLSSLLSNSEQVLLCGLSARLLVAEVRRRADSENTVEAALAIANFFCNHLNTDQQSDEKDRGAMSRLDGNVNQIHGLLSVVKIFLDANESRDDASSDNECVSELSEASLTSTLVKCVYLFFDLPKSKDQLEEMRRDLLHQTLQHLLLSLCTHTCAMDELVRSDDLVLLFSALTSPCVTHNRVYRKVAADALLSVARRGFGQSTLFYIHNKNCIIDCVESLRRQSSDGDFDLSELLEMFVSLFCLIKDASNDSKIVLEDFKEADGYGLIINTVLRIDVDDSEGEKCIRNLILLSSTLSFCGSSVASSPTQPSSSEQLSNFTMPLVNSNSNCVIKNIEVINMLSSLFNMAKDNHVTEAVLDALISLFMADKSNFFIIESSDTQQQLLTLFINKLARKGEGTQDKLFSILDNFVVQELRLVPFKELSAIALLLRENSSPECSHRAVQLLLSLLQKETVLRDVYREVGILESLVELAQSLKQFLNMQQNATADVPEVALGLDVLAALTECLISCNENTSVIRESMGLAVALSLLTFKESRSASLALLQQSLMTSSAEEDMRSILDHLQDQPRSDLLVTHQMLAMLQKVLADSHRCRSSFRRAEGFSCFLKILQSLGNTNINYDEKNLIDVIDGLFGLIAIAMRYEPANAKAFFDHVTMVCAIFRCKKSHFCSDPSQNWDEQWIEALRDLGRFGGGQHCKDMSECEENMGEVGSSTKYDISEPEIKTKEIFVKGFTSLDDSIITADSSCNVTAFQGRIMGLLLGLAVDNIEARHHILSDVYQGSVDQSEEKNEDEECNDQTGSAEKNERRRRRTVPKLELNPDTKARTSRLVYPHVLLVILKLLSCVQSSSTCVQTTVLEVILRLLSTHRAQRSLSSINEYLIPLLLQNFKVAFQSTEHPLHDSVRSLLIIASKYRISVGDLKSFLSGQEQNAKLMLAILAEMCDDNQDYEQRVLQHVHGQPPFVEFDMSQEGFACFYLPSIAPSQVVGTVSSSPNLSGNSTQVGSGVGQGERSFPPQSGLTFSTWICVNKYSDPRRDGHPLRLLTIARAVVNPATNSEEHHVCLSVSLSARDKAIIIVTRETPLTRLSSSNDTSDEVRQDGFGCRLWCPDLLKENQWHHLIVVLNNRNPKKPTLAIFVDGAHLLNDEKLEYLNLLPGNVIATTVSTTSTDKSSATPSSSLSSSPLSLSSLSSNAYALIGTPPYLRRFSRLSWKQGPCLLLEDVIKRNTASIIYKLGPSYTGSLQAPQLCSASSSDTLTALVPESNVSFGLNASSISSLTLSNMKQGYNKLDCKLIAKQLNMSINENATPIFVAHNTALHLNGSARTLGGVVLGYLGIQVVRPQPAFMTLEYVGGMDLLLGIVAMANCSSSLFNAIQVFFGVINNNPLTQDRMEVKDGYKVLALLLRQRRALINIDIVNLLFDKITFKALTILRDNSSSRIRNGIAFRDVLCDLPLWTTRTLTTTNTMTSISCEEAVDWGEQQPLLLHVMQRVVQLLQPSKDSGETVRALREANMVDQLVSLLTPLAECSSEFGPQAPFIIGTNFDLLYSLLATTPRTKDMLALALLPASLVTPLDDEEEDCSRLGSENVLELTDEWKESDYDYNIDKDALNFEDAFAWSVESDENCVKRRVSLRNQCLHLLITLTSSSTTKNASAQHYSQDLMQLLGYDYLFLFLQPHLHRSTMLLGLKLVSNVLTGAPSNVYEAFMTGSMNGRWLVSACFRAKNTNCVVTRSQSFINESSSGVRREALAIPGFKALCYAANNLATMDETYDILCQMAKEEGGDRSQTKNFVREEIVIVLIKMVTFALSKGIGPSHEQLFETLKTLFNLHDHSATSIEVFGSDEILKGLLSLHRATNDEALGKHRSALLSFLRTLVLDSFSLPFHTKNKTVIDRVLSVHHDDDADDHDDDIHNQRTSVVSFQADFLHCLLHYLRSVTPSLLSSSPSPSTSLSSASQYRENVSANLFFVLMRITDKLWANVIDDSIIPSPSNTPSSVLQLLLSLVTEAKQSNEASICIHYLFRSLNRVVLHRLSRAKDDLSDLDEDERSLVLDALIVHRSALLGAGNHDLEFFGCLTFCLLALHENLTIPSQQEPSESDDDATDSDGDCDEDDQKQKEARHDSTMLLTKLRPRCNKLWRDLFFCKRASLEEVLKVSFGNYNNTPNLDAVLTMLWTPAKKIWMSFLNSELQHCSQESDPWTLRSTSFELQTQLESRLQRFTGNITGGLRRLRTTVNKGNSKSSSVGNGSSVANVVNETKRRRFNYDHFKLSKKSYYMDTKLNLRLVLSSLIRERRESKESLDHLHKYLETTNLASIKYELSRETGVFGPKKGNKLGKWMLDMSEGPSRMRKKMIRNHRFYQHYFHNDASKASSNNGKQPRFKRPTSHDCLQWQQYEATERDRLLRLNLFDESLQSSSLNDADYLDEYDDCDISVDAMDINAQIQSLGFQKLQKCDTDDDDDNDNDDDNAETNDDDDDEIGIDDGSKQSSSLSPSTHERDIGPDYSNVMRLLESNERITHLYRCARLQGLDAVEGLLMFGLHHFYIVDGFTLIRGEIRDLDDVPEIDAIVPEVQQRPASKGSSAHSCITKLVHKFDFESVKEVHRRRCLLQPIAIEIFASDGRNYLLAFHKDVRPRVYQRFLAKAKRIIDNKDESVAGQRLSANVEQPIGILSSLIGETSVTQRWVRGEISNFKYLMSLNTLAGRSYNDLMQYPVFPWVLSDYESDDLDLGDESVFRDLSRPMGAQTAKRLEQFQKRFEEWEDPSGSTPPYHFGTHYSSAMIVASFLIRLEPFTQHFLKLQGGHFDLADRMFHSVSEAWQSASAANMADVRELVPEFFYLPDFLVNENNFDLGTKQSGCKLNDVILPPWAKGSAREFIRVHRMALESEYVSQRLHQWIDLIFGYKQSGPAAVDACNVFHHLFYEGNVDIFSISDPVQRNATIGFINNFGQIPKQLFRKPHPQKRLSSKSTSAGSTTTTTATALPTTTAVEEQSWSSRIIYRHLSHLTPSLSPVLQLRGPVGQIACDSYKFNQTSIVAVEQNKTLVPQGQMKAGQGGGGGGSTAAAMVGGGSRYYLAWGFADQSLRLGVHTHQADQPDSSLRPLLICEPPSVVLGGQVLTCVCPSANIVLIGGMSCLLIIYEFNKAKKRLVLREVLHGHEDSITCLAASAAWNVAVSGSRDGRAILWNLCAHTYVRHLEHSDDRVDDENERLPLSAVAINELSGDIATCAGDKLRLFDVNGRLVAQVSTSSSPTLFSQILCVAFSQWNEWERENVIVTGSTDGVVRIWSLDYVETRRSKERDDNSLESKDGFVLVPTTVEKSKVNKTTSSCRTIEYEYRPELVFRAHLTMHTAFERADNDCPAAVTAIGIARDHKTLLIGDERGRIFAWTLSNKPGKGVMDHWVRDEGSSSCSSCSSRFTLYERRHHCRSCGQLFCSSCSQYRARVPKLGIHDKVRVCKMCRDELRLEEQGDRK